MSNTCKKCGHWNGGVVLCEHYAEEAERREQERQVGAELKQLIEDAAKLLSLELIWDGVCPPYFQTEIGLIMFNPLDPERGDLMKVAMAAKVVISYYDGWVRWVSGGKHGQEHFLCGDHASLALAILRAASAVLHSRGD